MKIICGWCRMDMGTKPGPEGQTTHSICPACLKKLNEQMDAMEVKK